MERYLPTYLPYLLFALLVSSRSPVDSPSFVNEIASNRIRIQEPDPNHAAHQFRRKAQESLPLAGDFDAVATAFVTRPPCAS